MAAKNKSIYQKRVEQGLCQRCGKEKLVPGKKKCQKCLDQVRKAVAKLNDKRRKEKRCIDCKRKIKDGQWRCSKCKAKINANRAEQRKQQRAAAKQSTAG